MNYHSTNWINNPVRTYNDTVFKVGLYLATQTSPVLYARMLHASIHRSLLKGTIF